MYGSSLVGWMLVALTTGTGVLCLVRMRTGPGADRRTVCAEGAMAFGMALMALPAIHVGWQWPVLAVLFGGLAVHFVVFARGGHRVHHAVEAAAMLYMAVVMARAPGHGGHGSAGGAAATSGLGAPHDMGSMSGMTTTPGMPGMPGMGSSVMGVHSVNVLLLGYFVGYTVWVGVHTPVLVAAGGPRSVSTALGTAALCRLASAVTTLVMVLLML